MCLLMSGRSNRARYICSILWSKQTTFSRRKHMYFLVLFRPGPAWLADAPLEEQHWHAQGQPMPPAWSVPDGPAFVASLCAHSLCLAHLFDRGFDALFVFLLRLCNEVASIVECLY